jgi:hypothetical protein
MRLASNRCYQGHVGFHMSLSSGSIQVWQDTSESSHYRRVRLVPSSERVIEVSSPDIKMYSCPYETRSWMSFYFSIAWYFLKYHVLYTYTFVYKLYACMCVCVSIVRIHMSVSLNRRLLFLSVASSSLAQCFLWSWKHHARLTLLFYEIDLHDVIASLQMFLATVYDWFTHSNLSYFQCIVSSTYTFF